jgi:5-methyltetrahydropteroyltriglutamate--homocysteine methyltransferase
MTENKAFLTTQVGSWPRSKEMLKMLRGYQKGKVSQAEFNTMAEGEIRRTVALQEQAGLDIVVDGEHRRESFYAFITDKVAGTQLMSLADMLDFVEDKAEFEEMLRTMDMPASAVKNPTCTGKLSRREPLAVNDLHFLRTITDKPVKITLPGPYLLTRSMWVGALTRKVYRNHKKMADDIVRILREELLDLRDAGCDFVQFDEPVLTEVVMSEECERRTFM